MSAAWPVIVGRLVELLPALPGWGSVAVYDGPPVTADTPDAYVTVGFVVGEDFGGTYEQAVELGGLRTESGTVRSEVVCGTGDVDLPAVRGRAFALVDAWEAEVRRDETLGVLLPSSTASLAVDVAPAQTTGGAVQRLTVTLSYFARS